MFCYFITIKSKPTNSPKSKYIMKVITDIISLPKKIRKRKLQIPQLSTFSRCAHYGNAGAETEDFRKATANNLTSHWI